MAEKKRVYEKPVIQDLGNMLSGSAQMPMGLCSSGDSPSEPQQSCTGGAGVSAACPDGNLFTEPQEVCQAGGIAANYCGWGSSN